MLKLALSFLEYDFSAYFNEVKELEMKSQNVTENAEQHQKEEEARINTTLCDKRPLLLLLFSKIEY